MPGLNAKIRSRLTLTYVLTDLLTSALAIFVFNIIRAHSMEEPISVWHFYHFPAVWSGQILFPLMMMGLYWLSGYYSDVYFRSRAQELVSTFVCAIIGAFAIFFLAVVNDVPHRRLLAYEQIAIIAALLFAFVYAGRFFITRIEVSRIHQRFRFDSALMLGVDDEAVSLAQRINSLPKGMGLEVTSLVRLSPDDEPAAGAKDFEVLEIEKFASLCNAKAVQHVILSPSLNGNRKEMTRVLRTAFPLDVAIYVAPDINMLHTTSHRSFNVLGEPLVCISRANVTASAGNLKRLCDLVLSSVALVLLSPIFAAIAIAIKREDGGPVFFRQERLGYRNRPFRIIKFRTMRENAEDDTPMLTADDDTRITQVGRTLRKYRLDEMPQFWNVIKGEMSVVGPRPERRYFAEQIAARVPNYHMIYQVRPGITSWGMVRYGYASTVDQMIERLRYDMIYLENISLTTDFKILLHTVNTVVSGRGK